MSRNQGKNERHTSIIIPDIQEQILIGGLLGDASIPKLQYRALSYKIQWTHCMEQ